MSAAEGRAALADRRIVTLRKLHDKFVRGRGLSRRDDLVHPSIRLAERDIVANRAAEQCSLLQDNADLRAQRFDGHIAHVVAVYQHASLARVVKAREQIDDGRFAAARRAEKRHGLPRFGFERDVIQHRLAALEIAKSHAIESHVSLYFV